MVNVRLRKEKRLLQVLLSFGTFLLAAGCSDEKPLPPSTTNAAAAIPVTNSPSAVSPSDTRESALTVTGPIIVAANALSARPCQTSSTASTAAPAARRAAV